MRPADYLQVVSCCDEVVPVVVAVHTSVYFVQHHLYRHSSSQVHLMRKMIEVALWMQVMVVGIMTMTTL